MCKTSLNWQRIQINSNSSLSTRKIEITKIAKIRILITWMCESFSISMSRTNDTHDKRSNWRIISRNIGYFRKQFNKHNLVFLHRQIPSFHTQQKNKHNTISHTHSQIQFLIRVLQKTKLYNIQNMLQHIQIYLAMWAVSIFHKSTNTTPLFSAHV